MVVWQSSTIHQLDFFQPFLGCQIFKHQSMNWMTGDSLWLDLGLKRFFKDFYMEVAQPSDFIFRQAFLNELLLQAGDLFGPYLFDQSSKSVLELFNLSVGPQLNYLSYGGD